MKKPEGHVVSLETAKRMKELGWDKECLFQFTASNELNTKYKKYYFEVYDKALYDPKWDIMAPTASEILQVLPEKIELSGRKVNYWLHLEKCGDKFRVCYVSIGEHEIIDKQGDIHNTCADVWIWLKTEKYI